MRSLACTAFFLSVTLGGCTPDTPSASGDASEAQPAVAATVDSLVAEDRSVAELQARMTSGDTSAVSLTRHYLERIAAVDDAGPRLNAVISLNPAAIEEATERDRERSAGNVRGPLHGIPVLLKDNIDARGMVTSAGSLALADHRPPQDAFLVSRLREAGAVILGKTNLSEWANFRSTESSSGWSGLGGQTRNPYVLDRSPCGSSSGSGVAVAAGLAPLAVGTETDGSIICPAAVNGIVGIKPTLGLVSRGGIVPISPSQDTAGPMASSVADAATLLQALVAADGEDPAAEPDRAEVDYLAALRADALQGARIGVMRKAMGYHPEVDRVMEAAIIALREAGAEVVDPADLPTHGEFGKHEFEVLLYEFRPALEAYLARSKAPVGTLEALIGFNREHAARSMPWFGQELFEQSAAKGPLSEPAYVEAREVARRLAGTEGIDAALAAHQVDALLTSAVSPAWSIDFANGDHFRGAGYSAAAVAGYPSITVPAGSVHGLPIGVVFMGRAHDEARLIGYAHAFEQRTRARRPPSFRPSLLSP
ncbi:amidase [Pseudomarimonas salicorniae]|uniref:Amidase n=1 Tax=Pseudomarimonas salicorniae TaxID=2933270 RepID=A0ABT0GF70_9GAMM|nr:amidase [Lysobacter sp. CAU 1642]MCK7593191.1 amidase [Lysobacter sp. CAU 1642]